MVSYTARGTRVTVYETEIDAAFKYERGDVRANMRWAGFGHVILAQRMSPTRTGAMQRSIGYNITPSGKYETRYHLTVGVDYAVFVLGGTTGPIFPNRGVFMWVRPKPRSYYIRYTPRMQVAGQSANDFLTRSTHALFAALRIGA